MPPSQTDTPRPSRMPTERPKFAIPDEQERALRPLAGAAGQARAAGRTYGHGRQEEHPGVREESSRCARAGGGGRRERRAHLAERRRRSSGQSSSLPARLRWHSLGLGTLPFVAGPGQRARARGRFGPAWPSDRRRTRPGRRSRLLAVGRAGRAMVEGSRGHESEPWAGRSSQGPQGGLPGEVATLSRASARRTGQPERFGTRRGRHHAVDAPRRSPGSRSSRLVRPGAGERAGTPSRLNAPRFRLKPAGTRRHTGAAGGRDR